MRKKMGKLMAGVLTVAFTFSAMSLSAFASKTASAVVTPGASVTPSAKVTGAAEKASEAYGVEVALYLQESNDQWSFGEEDPKTWSEPKSESVMVTKDGTYTVSLTDLDIPVDNFTLCYIKDVAAYNAKKAAVPSNLPKDTMIITNVVKVNGVEKKIADGVRTGLYNGLFDVAYHNNWLDTDNVVEFNEDVKSVEVTFTVTGITGEPGSIEYVPTEVAATPTVAAAQTSTGTTDTTATDTKESEDKGNAMMLIIVIVAVVAVAAVGIVVTVSKKKKA